MPTLTKSILFIFSIFILSSIWAKRCDAEIRDLAGTAEIIKAKTDYQRMLVEAQLSSAKALELRATAELKFAQAAYYRKMLQVLEYEFNRLQREEINVKARMAEVEFYASRCAGLKIGEVTDVTFYGLRWLLVAVLPSDVIAAEAGKVLPELSEDNFIATHTVPVRAFPGGNLGQLFKFLEKNRYSMAEWSDAHMSVLKFMASVTAAVDARIQRYVNYMDGIRAGSLDVWKLPNE